MYRKNKYRNCKVEFDGHNFDSRKEFTRYCYLKQLLENGEIKNLELQKRYVLVPKQKLKTPRYRFGRTIKSEQEVTYIADFVYEDSDGNVIVEDTKSNATRTTQYIIKRKLMLYVHGIEIVEL